MKNTEPQFREFCVRCLKAQRSCLCHMVQPFEANAIFVILMHPKERRRRSGTGSGRLAHLCISNSILLEGMNFDDDARVEDLINRSDLEPFVLFPSPDSLNLSNNYEVFKHKCETRVPLIFVIDGSWSCAKKLMKINPKLNLIPKISFTVKAPSCYDIKRQPRPECLSTLESIYTLVTLMSEDDSSKNLMDVFKEMVKFQKGFSSRNPRSVI